MITKILGITLYCLCASYGLRQAWFGKPAFRLDYWITMAGMILSIYLLVI